MFVRMVCVLHLIIDDADIKDSNGSFALVLYLSDVAPIVIK